MNSKPQSLAIDGGPPVRPRPWPQWPYFAEDEIQAVAEVLRSGRVNYWTGPIFSGDDGSAIRGLTGRFETEFARWIGTKYAVAVPNGTLALELCLYALNIGPGDEVIVPNRTYIASALAVAVRGAIPVFADIDRNSQNISAATIRPVLTPRTRAIICVHLGGCPCEMAEIMALAEEHHLKVIEDCAQCLGAKYRERRLGSIGHMAAFSFCHDKIMTTGGEGGMITVNRPELYCRAWSYKDHGKNFHRYQLPLHHPLADAALAARQTDYTSIGTNWRMTEMQAAIGLRQLTKVPEWVVIRRRFAAMLDAGLADVPGLIVLPPPPPHFYHAYYKYYALLRIEKLAEGWTRDRVIAAINAEGVFCTYGSNWDLGREDVWNTTIDPISGSCRQLRLSEPLPNDHYFGLRSMMFQVHPTLNEEAIQDTIAAVRKVLAAAVTP
ncbi:MAG: DegT/DnrJ/EryC1/StrS aminotransferase family protein [Victivallales bacterium]|nr:DegT/DnrJ/EryC1/StrS aminotransferase family protein [Victivallales bacterium]